MILIHDFVQVPVDVRHAEEALGNDQSRLLHAAAVASYREAEEFCAGLEPEQKDPGSCRGITLDIGTPWRRDEGVVLPVHWWASGAAHVFSRLDADLEIMPIGGAATQITLMGRYEPAGPTGHDGLRPELLHRVAEVSVRSFLVRLAEGITGSAEAAVLIPARVRSRSRRVP